MRFVAETFTDNTTVLEQEITTLAKMRVERIRPWLAFDNPGVSATLKLSITTLADVEIISKTMTVAQLQSAIATDTAAPYTIGYEHGLYSFIFASPFTLYPGKYKIKIQRTGTFSTDTQNGRGWIAWVQQHDDPFIPMYANPDVYYNDYNRPFWLEIWSYKVI